MIVLRQNSLQAIPFVPVIVFEISAVYQNRSIARVVQPGQYFHKRAFPRAVRTDYAHKASGGNSEGNITQSPLYAVVAGIIIKTDIPELNIPDSGVNLLACIVDDFALYPAELPMMLKRESLAVHL